MNNKNLKINQKSEDSLRVVGIDLGTTNSLISICLPFNDESSESTYNDDNEQDYVINYDVEIMDDEYQDVELRNKVEIIAKCSSSVYYTQNGKIIVGEEAEKEESCLRSIKRLMGLGLKDITANDSNYTKNNKYREFNIDFNLSNESIIYILCSDHKSRTPIEISSDILKYLKEQAETKLKMKLDNAVITVPAYFDDAARSATRVAAYMAGFNVLRLINEPTSAAIAYGSLDKKNCDGKYFLVYDLGGGTFDVSIVKSQYGVLEVFATGGIRDLGGNDFDKALADHYKINNLQLARSIREWLSENDSFEFKDILKFNDTKSISSTRSITEILNNLKKQKEILPIIKKSDLEEICIEIVQKTIRIMQSVIDDAKIDINDIEEIILVGGTTRMPMIKKIISDSFFKKLKNNINPDDVVAIGAGIQAGALSVNSGILLLDVNPLTLGIEVANGCVDQIIPRNTPIPSIIKKSFGLYEDNQELVKIHVVQGESDLVKECRSLAKFSFKCSEGCSKENDRIEITFCLDVNGILTVTAQERKNGIPWGQIKEITIKPSYGLDSEIIDNLLKNKNINNNDILF
ncbi:Hsp70 family protein [Lyticum sinuosum]|uniref:Chaperone protein HscA n=1 Tax=Lyticum sinuosum TaxID=1332059 RepID=A0AAE4VJW5_9RICK|nr:Hsp70 family protein [Lyticum sinuosum]MDZ5761286.1 Chaperone protein HscA [Lyticum sinuosum]